MAGKSHRSRREFLVSAGKMAAVAGLATAAVQAATKIDPGPALAPKAGPKPKAIDANAPLRLGLVGVGGRGRYVLEQLLKVEPSVVIKAIADVDNNSVNEAKKMITGNPDVYNGPDDFKDKLLAREDIDAVILATPCYLHTPMYLECFAAGKHFYGEKPMSITVNEAKAMVAAQEKNPQVIAQIGFQRRATELYQKAAKLLKDGVVGEFRDCRMAWNNSWGPLGLPGDGARIWFGRRKMSGDWMLEQACHSWDVMNWMAGALPVAASGVGYRGIFKEADPERDVTDLYYAHLEYPGFFVDFEHSWMCPHNDEGRFTGVFERISGLKGGMALNEGKLYSRDPNKKVEQFADGTGDPVWTQNSMAAFVKSLRTGMPVVSGVKEGRDATFVGLLVRQAVDEHRRVEMKEIVNA